MSQTSNLEILIATHNPGKIREIQAMLGSLPVKLRLLREFTDISAVEETGETYGENARLKALSYARQTGLWALADDSGLEVEALGGMPGVFSARFGGELLSDRERSEGLLLALSHHSHSTRAARFVCSTALAGWRAGDKRSDTSEPTLLNVTEGICDGFIVTALRGGNGFGFDPIFAPTGHSQTFAELPREVKGKISHRAKAIANIKVFLKRYLSRLDRSFERA
jgi:XTP/dITP diphosphohydrolase